MTQSAVARLRGVAARGRPLASPPPPSTTRHAARLAAAAAAAAPRPAGTPPRPVSAPASAPCGTQRQPAAAATATTVAATVAAAAAAHERRWVTPSPPWRGRWRRVTRWRRSGTAQPPQEVAAAGAGAWRGRGGRSERVNARGGGGRTGRCSWRARPWSAARRAAAAAIAAADARQGTVGAAAALPDAAGAPDGQRGGGGAAGWRVDPPRRSPASGSLSSPPPTGVTLGGLSSPGTCRNPSARPLPPSLRWVWGAFAGRHPLRSLPLPGPRASPPLPSPRWAYPLSLRGSPWRARASSVPALGRRWRWLTGRHTGLEGGVAGGGGPTPAATSVVAPSLPSLPAPTPPTPFPRPPPAQTAAAQPAAYEWRGGAPGQRATVSPPHPPHAFPHALTGALVSGGRPSSAAPRAARAASVCKWGVWPRQPPAPPLQGRPAAAGTRCAGAPRLLGR